MKTIPAYFNTTKFFSDKAIIFYFFVFKILVHLLNSEYGYFRDELFFIDISKKYSFDNLDILPLTPLYLKLITSLFGFSLKAIHFASALPGALSIILTCLMAKELGGKKYAIFFTGLSTLFSGFIIFGAMFTYDSIDFLVWVTVIYLLVRLFKENKPNLWLAIGFFIGLGLLNKLTILFLCLSIFLTLWIVPQRKNFKTKCIWFAGCISVLFLVPFIIWQVKNDWYFIGWAQNYAGGNSYISTLPEFIWNQVLPNNIFNLPIWASGLFLLLFRNEWKKYRYFGYNYLFLFFLFYLLGVKFYFLIPFYTILLAVGSIQIEKKLNKYKGALRKSLLISLPLIYFFLSLVGLPMSMPILSVEQFAGYSSAMGMGTSAGVRYENNQLNVNLPQHFADRFGWEEMVQEIAGVYHNIPETKNDVVGIFCNNSGQAAAINFYRNKYGLPEAISAHGWFFFHAKQNHNFKRTYITIGDEQGMKDFFNDVRLITIFTHPLCMPYESNKEIHVCRDPKGDIKEYWNTLKH